MSAGPAGPGRGPGGFEHRIRVRYGDCDMQGVVFNPTYLAYVDDTVDVWFQTAIGPDYLDRFEYAVKRATVEWEAPARPQDTVSLRPAVSRWGTTSMDVTVTLDVGERRIAEVVVTLVSVTPGEYTPVPVPAFVRDALTPSGP